MSVSYIIVIAIGLLILFLIAPQLVKMVVNLNKANECDNNPATQCLPYDKCTSKTFDRTKECEGVEGEMVVCCVVTAKKINLSGNPMANIKVYLGTSPVESPKISLESGKDHSLKFSATGENIEYCQATISYKDPVPSGEEREIISTTPFDCNTGKGITFKAESKYASHPLELEVVAYAEGLEINDITRTSNHAVPKILTIEVT